MAQNVTAKNRIGFYSSLLVIKCYVSKTITLYEETASVRPSDLVSATKQFVEFS